jgi:hypothetical protein
MPKYITRILDCRKTIGTRHAQRWAPSPIDKGIRTVLANWTYLLCFTISARTIQNPDDIVHEMFLRKSHSHRARDRSDKGQWR